MKGNRKQQTTKTIYKKMHRNLLRFLDLPSDSDGTVLKITMVADTDLLIENHCGVIRYTESLIRLNSEHGIIRIEGKDLQLSEFAAERAYIQGKVFGWHFEDASGCGNP